MRISVHLILAWNGRNDENGRFIFEVFVCVFIVCTCQLVRVKVKWKKAKGKWISCNVVFNRNDNTMWNTMWNSLSMDAHNTKAAQYHNRITFTIHTEIRCFSLTLSFSCLWSQIVFTIFHRMKSVTVEERSESQCWKIWLWSLLACVAVYNTIYGTVHLWMTKVLAWKWYNGFSIG